MNPKIAAIKAAREAGKILMKYFKNVKRGDIKTKGKLGLVSNADLESEAKIVSILRKHFPNYDIISEEEINIDTGADYRWFIDPLDGTHNYLYGMPYFGVSIALAYKNKVILGVIYLPWDNELYVAERGKGAFFGKERLHVSSRSLKDAVLCYDGALHRLKGVKLKKLSKLVDNVFRVRIFGAAVINLLAIAKGQAEMYIEFSSNPWDVAAGFLIVEEAGGMITDHRGKPWTPYVSKFAVTNGKIHKDVLNILRD